jgi:hypothetical protein
MAPSCGLLDLTVYGRREFREDSPAGRPQRWSAEVACFSRTVTRPPTGHDKAGRNDDLGTVPRASPVTDEK